MRKIKLVDFAADNSRCLGVVVAMHFHMSQMMMSL
jgi:hypothetical protein